MRIVILGAGLLGIQTVRELSKENKDVIVNEQNPDIARAFAIELDRSVLKGDREYADFLTEAGFEFADWFIVLTGRDEANIVACGIVSEIFKKPEKITRVCREAFSGVQPDGNHGQSW